MSAKKPPAPDSVLLSDVRALTLRKDAKTAHRRVPAIPQVCCCPSLPTSPPLFSLPSKRSFVSNISDLFFLVLALLHITPTTLW